MAIPPRLISRGPTTIAIGSAVNVDIATETPDVEVRIFLSQNGILYPNALAEWRPPSSLQFYPEAPGNFVIGAQWRSNDGTNGWIDQAFTVVAADDIENPPPNGSAADGPTLLEIEDQRYLWSMSGWEAGLVRHWESDVFDTLERLIEPHFVFYDIGANVGFYSVLASRLVGPQGLVYCVEANPVCVYLLASNMNRSGHGNFIIIPVAMAEGPGTTRFKINYSNSNLGLTEDSELFLRKMGQEIQVATLDFDSMISSFDLRPPDLIKIDIEGAEGFAIQGMKRSLQSFRPALLIEIHGESAARATYETLESLAYRIFSLDATAGPHMAFEELIDRARQGVFHVLARPTNVADTK